MAQEADVSQVVFADTFYWIALCAADDYAHLRAVKFDSDPRKPPIVTTDEVLAEFLTFFGCQGPHLRSRAAAVVRRLIADRRITVLPQTHGSFQSRLELYAARVDKSYSFTDCVSMQVMRREGISEALTDDRHFEQEGFIALLRA